MPYYCYSCHEVRGSCEGCGGCSNANCNDSCSCPKIKFFRYKPKFHASTSRQHKSNVTDRFIAAEIEVADIRGKTSGTNIAKVVRKWRGSIVTDGSIPETGFEINTSPASGDLFVQQIKEICKQLSLARATVTTECGLHVHLDARDFNFHDIKRLVKVYAIIEPALFDMVPRNRRRLHYCAPCGTRYEQAIAGSKLPYQKVKSDIVIGTYKRASTSERTHKYSDARYNALNLHSWFYRGTIECRLFNGTVNANDIIRWGVLWAHILDYALHTSEEDISLALHKENSLKSLMTIIKGNRSLGNFIRTRYKRYTTEAA